MSGPVLAVFPHPDDETFSAGALFAAATERGIPVTLIMATRGEAGESGSAGAVSPEQLGVIREGELRAAMAHLGVSDVRFLDYRDSGMEGSAEATHPSAFVAASMEEVVARLVPIMREVRPETVVTFARTGIYGHPDHIHTHDATVQAVLDAADPAYDPASLPAWQTPILMLATAPREEMQAHFAQSEDVRGALSETAWANLGSPREEITHFLNTDRWAAAKRAAIAAHETQTGEDGPLSDAKDEVMEREWLNEYYMRAALPWDQPIPPHGIIDELIAHPGT